MYFTISTICCMIVYFLIQPFLLLSWLSVPSLSPVISLSFPSIHLGYTIRAADSVHLLAGLSSCRTEGESPALLCLERHSRWWKGPEEHVATIALRSSSRTAHWFLRGAPAACGNHLSGTFMPCRKLFWSCRGLTANKHSAAVGANSSA